MTRRAWLAAGLLVIPWAASLDGTAQTPTAQTPAGLTKRDADSMEKKLTAIEARGQLPRPGKATVVQTSFTEREVNSYLRFNGQSKVPKGIINPEILIPGESRLTARATVDLDAVRKSKPRAWYDPANLLTGLVDIRASGVLQTSGGKGTFQVESATFGGIPIPRALLAELVSYYSRTPDTPNGVTLDQPFALPANIREVRIRKGEATIVQ